MWHFCQFDFRKGHLLLFYDPVYKTGKTILTLQKLGLLINDITIVAAGCGKRIRISKLAFIIIYVSGIPPGIMLFLRLYAH